MRKDYIFAENIKSNEIKFVEDHWTKKWDDLGGKRAGLKKIFNRQEYKIMTRVLRGLSAGAKIFDGGCGLGDWVLALNQQGFRVTGMDVSKK